MTEVLRTLGYMILASIALSIFMGLFFIWFFARYVWAMRSNP